MRRLPVWPPAVRRNGYLYPGGGHGSEVLHPTYTTGAFAVRRCHGSGTWVPRWPVDLASPATGLRERVADTRVYVAIVPQTLAAEGTAR